MFTGIISAIGSIESAEPINGGVEIVVHSPGFFDESKVGDSVAINGVCLTITSFDENRATFFSQIETNSKTTITKLDKGSNVNLEHPLRFNDRLGGHLVQGHVDGTVEIKGIEDKPDGSRILDVDLKKDFERFIADRGSVTLNGVSLTVANKDATSFSVALIPATLEHTTFSSAQVGDTLNIEVDCIAKYVDQLIAK